MCAASQVKQKKSRRLTKILIISQTIPKRLTHGQLENMFIFAFL